MNITGLTHAEAACKAFLNILADEYLKLVPSASHRRQVNYFAELLLGMSWDQYLIAKYNEPVKMQLYARLVMECKNIGFDKAFIDDVVLYRAKFIYAKFNNLSTQDTDRSLDYVDRLIRKGYYDLVDNHNFHFVALLSQLAAFYRTYKGFDTKGKSYTGSLTAVCPLITGVPFKWIKEGRYHGKPVPIRSKQKLLVTLKQRDVKINPTVMNELYHNIGNGKATDVYIFD